MLRDMVGRGKYGYGDLLHDVQVLTTTYPDLFSAGSIGQSVMGKSIIVLRIGQGKRNLHINGALHANEWITAPALLHVFKDYAASYHHKESSDGTDHNDWFHRNSLWIVPMANPDGVELVQEGITPEHPYYHSLLKWNNGSLDFSGWKANIRGVDLGDQFPAYWTEEVKRRDSRTPRARDYCGPSPLSEPEASALAEFTRTILPESVLSLHSQGQEIYWNYRGYEPPESGLWAERLAEASQYRAVKLEGSDAGYKDWFIKEFRKPGFTVEVGLGENPLPASQFEQIKLELGRLIDEWMMLE